MRNKITVNGVGRGVGRGVGDFFYLFSKKKIKIKKKIQQNMNNNVSNIPSADLVQTALDEVSDAAVGVKPKINY